MIPANKIWGCELLVNNQTPFFLIDAYNKASDKPMSYRSLYRLVQELVESKAVKVERKGLGRGLGTTYSITYVNTSKVNKIKDVATREQTNRAKLSVPSPV